jgi:hypothetical protein
VSKKPLSAADRFIRHLWLSFLVFTFAVCLLLGWVSVMPWGGEGSAAGRGVVALLALPFWFLGLIVALSCWWTARRMQDTDRGYGAATVFFWSLALLALAFVLTQVVPGVWAARSQLGKRRGEDRMNTARMAIDADKGRGPGWELLE